jgi:hypothetical protein
MLTNAYARQRFQYLEICRRFCIDLNPDPDVKKFRLEILRKGIPKEALNSERWDIHVNKVIGGGNKQLAIAMANELYGMRPVLDPSAQRTVDRSAYCGAHGQLSAGEEPGAGTADDFSSTVHDTELAYGALMSGSEVTPRPGLNPAEVAETILRLMAQTITTDQSKRWRGRPRTADSRDYRMPRTMRLPSFKCWRKTPPRSNW